VNGCDSTQRGGRKRVKRGTFGRSRKGIPRARENARETPISGMEMVAEMGVIRGGRGCFAKTFVQKTGEESPRGREVKLDVYRRKTPSKVHINS